MTFLEALAEAERTGEAIELPWDPETGHGGKTLALAWDRDILHFWESPVAPCGPGLHSGALLHVDDVRSNRWRMRPAPRLSNLWSRREERGPPSRGDTVEVRRDGEWVAVQIYAAGPESFLASGHGSFAACCHEAEGRDWRWPSERNL